MNERSVTRWLERAAEHQLGALALVREAQAGSRGMLPTDQRRDRLCWALERLVKARQLLQRAQARCDSPELQPTLDAHLQRLDALAESIERRLWELEQVCDAGSAN